MKSSGIRRCAFVLMCMLGIAYVGISVANVEQYASDKVTDGVKLAFAVVVCTIGFVLGREYFRFTHTTPVFLGAMILLVLLHVTELTEEFAAFRSVPLFGQVTPAKRAFETFLLTGSICLFLTGNFLSVSDISRAKRQLESNLQSLREREQRYRTLFEAANDAIVIMQGNRFTQCNSKALEMFGGTEEQIIGQTPWRFSPSVQPDGQNSDEKARQKLAQVLAGEAQSFEWTHCRYDGTPFDAEICLNLVEFGDGLCIQAIIRDISRRKEAEAERARLTAVLEATSDFVYMATPEGRIIYLNEAGRQMLGWLTDEVVYTRKIAHAHPEWAYRIIKEEGLPAAIQNGTWAGETAVWGPDGTEIPVSQVIMSHKSEDGDIEYLSTVIRDLRQNKRAEAERQKAQAFLEAAIAQSPSGILIADAPDVNIRVANSVALAIRGGDVGQLTNIKVGQHALTWQTFRPDGSPYPAEQLPLSRAVLHGKVVIGEEVIIRDEAGGDHCVSANAAPIRDAEGRIIAGIVVFHEITERKRIERERLDYQRRLRSLASELSLAEERERRRIAMGLHDHACQALVLSRMEIQSLCESSAQCSAGEVARICSTLDRAAASVRELMFDLSSPTLYKFGLEAALEELLEDKLKGHGIHGTFSNDKASKPLREDVRILLFQSVRELLINTVKHAEAREVSLNVARASDRVEITMTDDGVGFDVEEVLVAPPRGCGFGLFNIKERLDHIGGALDVRSQPGQGSRFTLVAHLETHAPPAEEPHDNQQHSGHDR